MGVTLKQLRKKSPKYDPDADVKVQAAWVTWMKENGVDKVEGSEGDAIPWDVGDPSIVLTSEDKMEEDFAKAVDMLDKVHLIMLDVHKLKIGRKLRFRVNEIIGELGEFLQDLYGGEESVH